MFGSVVKVVIWCVATAQLVDFVATSPWARADIYTNSDNSPLWMKDMTKWEQLAEAMVEREYFDSIASASQAIAYDGSANFFTSFHQLDEIDQFIAQLTYLHPELCKVTSLGQTHEGRNISMISISADPSNKQDKHVIFVQAGLHAREWIAPSTALYFAKWILVNFGDLSHVLNDFELQIVPMANPDGYHYSHTTDRKWRKNRRPISTHCTGVDLNRNYDFHWKETGTSSNPCSDLFGGTKAFSERETTALANHLYSNRNRIKAFVDVHSYGKYLFYPFGYKAKAYYRRKEHRVVANAMATAIERVHGTRYQIGTPANLLYESAGGSDDYAAGALGVPFVFTLELPDNSFEVRPDQIQPIGQETAVGLFAMVKKLQTRKSRAGS